VIALGTAGARSARWQGIGLCVVAVVAYAGAVVIQKPALARVSALRVTFYGCVAAAVACAPFLPGMASEIAKAPPAEVLWIVYLGLVPTSLGFATWSIALRRTTAGRAGALNFLIPVVAVVLGWAVLRESPAPLALAGGALTLLGVYTARRTRRRAPDPADRTRLIPQADPAAQPPSRGAG
jgi:drug/metabolite transporter (DMT)-like permease